MTAEEVKQEVVFDLRKRNLKRRDAGLLLGIKPQSVTNMLAAKGYFSAFQARRLHDCFGYDMEFLMTGKGVLMSGDPKQRHTVEGAMGSEAYYIDILEDFLQMNKRAIDISKEKGDWKTVEPIWSMMERYGDFVMYVRNLFIVNADGDVINIKGSFRSMIDPVREQLRKLLGLKKEG